MVSDFNFSQAKLTRKSDASHFQYDLMQFVLLFLYMVPIQFSQAHKKVSLSEAFTPFPPLPSRLCISCESCLMIVLTLKSKDEWVECIADFMKQTILLSRLFRWSSVMH